MCATVNAQTLFLSNNAPAHLVCTLSNAAGTFEDILVCYLFLPGLPLLQWQTTQ